MCAQPLPLPAENAISTRYLHLTMRWLPIARRYFSPWPLRPRCGHFFGGAHWYGLETVNPMFALALAASSPDYDPALTGLSRDEAQDMAVQALRYLCFTHDTGPADCIRPEKGLGRPETTGNKWGERGLGYFRESQCGHTLGKMARGAALLGDALGPEEWDMLRAISADYLDRFGTMEPKNGVYADTQMEENAWTSEGLTAALLMHPGYPNAADIWRLNRLWMFRTATRPDDIHNYAVFADGKTVRELCGRVYTTLPDGTVENHYIVHPSYLSSSVTISATVQVMLQLYGRPVPPELWWHRADVYSLLKTWCDDTGASHPVQGMDWPYLSYVSQCYLHAVGATILGDSDAAWLEERALEVVEGAARQHGGRLIPEAIIEHCHSIQDPALMNEHGMTTTAEAALLHRLYPTQEVLKDLPSTSPIALGVQTYPHGGALLHRHARGKTSLSWRNSTMVLPNTREGLRLIGPASGTLLAQVTVRDRPWSSEQLSLRLREGEHEVAAYLREAICQGSLERQVAFFSLSDGRCLTAERLIVPPGGEPVVVESLQQGMLKVMNDPYFSTTPDKRSRRRLFWEGHEAELVGYPLSDTGEDVTHVVSGSWLNVDDRFGLVFAGQTQARVFNGHLFRPWHAITDQITLAEIAEPTSFAPGEVVAQLATLWCPEEDHATTAQRTLRVQQWDDAGLVVQLDAATCLCNLAAQSASVGGHRLAPYEPVIFSAG